MTKETEALAAELRTILKELYRYGQHDKRPFGEDLLALGIYLERKLTNKIDRLPSRLADGIVPQPSVRPRHVPYEDEA